MSISDSFKLIGAGCLVFLLTGNLHAQPFEGSLKFEFRKVIINPDLRKQMEQPFEDVAAAANSEANQKALKQMQESMTQPGIKESLEANPEYQKMVNEQINAMRTQQQGAGMALDLANTSKMTLMLKDSSIRIDAKGRHFTTNTPYLNTLFLADSLKTYAFDHTKKTYQELPFVDDSASLAGTITRVKGDSVLHDFVCEKFEFSIDSTQQGKATGYMWVAPELAQLNGIWAHIPDMGFFRQAAGFPVHIVIYYESTKEDMFELFTLRSVEKERFSAEDFKLPTKYSVKQ
ncbi:MAG: hypothetical protein H6574_02670 [Lewinellaceae bacterium]|nr:hypothetical protein [Saprospiraceae bacterium]MCB9315701.1 hypothetical protein [Lewinellaceae bacterium]MCB9329963.1 hypothetical protein [Lewinellaceae bacterium]